MVGLMKDGVIVDTITYDVQVNGKPAFRICWPEKTSLEEIEKVCSEYVEDLYKTKVSQVLIHHDEAIIKYWLMPNDRMGNR